MAANNKRDNIQDEMSRFEAEIYSTIAESARTSTNIYPSGFPKANNQTSAATPISQPPSYSSTQKVFTGLAVIEPKTDDLDDVDDDVARALLAAAAGVTYSEKNKPGKKRKSTGNTQIEAQPCISAPPAPPQPKKKPSAPEPRMQHSTLSMVPPQVSYIPAMPNLNQPPPMIPNMTSVASSTMSADYAKLQAKNSAKPEEEYGKKNKKFLRIAAGKVWNDESLNEWDPNDFRIFCGDLGPEVTDETLVKTFNRYSSFKKAKVVRDKRSNKSKGYGFVSFDDPEDFTRAMREVNGKYVGSRPIKLRRSDWKSRLLDTHKKKEKEKKKLGVIL